MTTTAAERLARRYPARRSGRLDWRILAAVLAIAGLTWLGWAAWVGAHPPVAGRVDGFTVTSATDVEVKLSIDRPDTAQAATCLVYVQAASYERVGELTVSVPPGGEVHTVLTVNVRTVARGTTADLESCRTID